MLVLSQICWIFLLLLLLPFYSFRTNYLARDIFIDKQSFLRIEKWIRRSEESLGRGMSKCEVTYTNPGWEVAKGSRSFVVRTNLIYNYGYESLRRSRVRRWKIIIIKAAISCVRTIVYTCLLKVFLTIRDPLAQ